MAVVANDGCDGRTVVGELILVALLRRVSHPHLHCRRSSGEIDGGSGGDSGDSSEDPDSNPCVDFALPGLDSLLIPFFFPNLTLLFLNLSLQLSLLRLRQL